MKPETSIPKAPPETTSSEQDKKTYVSAVEFLSLLLSVLSQRTVLAISHILPIIALASGFALWWRVLPDPTVFQLTGLGLYAVFMLSILIVRR